MFEAVSRQHFHCLGLGLDGQCLGLGIFLAVLVLLSRDQDSSRHPTASLNWSFGWYMAILSLTCLHLFWLYAFRKASANRLIGNAVSKMHQHYKLWGLWPDELSAVNSLPRSAASLFEGWCVPATCAPVERMFLWGENVRRSVGEAVVS